MVPGLWFLGLFALTWPCSEMLLLPGGCSRGVWSCQSSISELKEPPACRSSGVLLGSWTPCCPPHGERGWQLPPELWGS